MMIILKWEEPFLKCAQCRVTINTGGEKENGYKVVEDEGECVAVGGEFNNIGHCIIGDGSYNLEDLTDENGVFATRNPWNAGNNCWNTGDCGYNYEKVCNNKKTSRTC